MLGDTSPPGQTLSTRPTSSSPLATPGAQGVHTDHTVYPWELNLGERPSQALWPFGQGVCGLDTQSMSYKGGFRLYMGTTPSSCEKGQIGALLPRPNSDAKGKEN